ncbi:transmembrane protein 201-like isoform X2 [Dreissena polymorpha]|uniref:transmembrane protein 201-like isoform X2 n=1 Tax=Dreissena polymorpha TaxID=45954 RepID=UPI0022642859|nr:transmembrane protein 201-like isoform X2 [Dreissena polymorpha]
MRPPLHAKNLETHCKTVRLDRPLFPAYVSCWFCGASTSLPYTQRNSWDCPKCEQYNGFEKDGSYNKAIVAQYDESYNRPINCKKAEFLGGHDLLCDKCCQNQLLKVKQLANFTPYNEKSYDCEVEAFSAHLEKVYRLCPQCEIRVSEELETQNEALCMRLSHLDESQRSLLGLSLNSSTLDPPVLHSSYSDRKLNRTVLCSVILHVVALVCALLLGAKEISLEGGTDWQRRLLPLHPLLLWLDRTASVVSVLGLFSGIVAKLVLGKYRLRIVDAASCPVWLFVLLSENSSLHFQQSYFPYKTTGLVTNILTSLASVAINRRRRNQSNMTLTRQVLDNSLSDSASSVSPLSSVSQVTSRSPLKGQRSKEAEFRPEPPSLPVFMQERGDEGNAIVQEATVSTSKSNKEDQKYPVHKEAKVDDHSETVDDTATELKAFTLGEPTAIKRNNSGMFSAVGIVCAADSTVSGNHGNQSILEGLRARGMGQRRPLISPASFSHHSPVDKHRHSPVHHGLFSSPPSTAQFSSYPSNRSSLSGFSTFSNTNLFSTERLSITPERPRSPMVSAFGRPPFLNVPLQSDRLSQCSGHVSTKSFCVARQPGSIAKSGSHSREMSDDSDNDMENSSDFTSVTNRCRVESTSASTAQENKVSWWKHPGFVGFILGGSVVANILLGLQMITYNKTQS